MTVNIEFGPPVTFLVHYEDSIGRAQHILWSTRLLEANSGRSESVEDYVSCGMFNGLAAAFLANEIGFDVVGIWAGGIEMRRELRRRHNNRQLCKKCLFGRAKQLRLL